MAYKLVVSKEAHEDTDGIVQYIAVELHNPPAAIDFLGDVERGYKNVADHPEMYSYCADKKLRLQGYRKIVVKNYVIIYRVEEPEQTVIILRIVYAGRDYPELF